MQSPVTAATHCPICKQPVQPDSAGFLECRCGWGGPGDPVESARGFSRWVTLRDRRWASAIAWGDLRRIVERKGPGSSSNPLYLLTLLALATVVYVALGALGAFIVSLLVFYAQAGVWVAVVLAGCALVYLY